MNTTSNYGEHYSLTAAEQSGHSEHGTRH